MLPIIRRLQCALFPPDPVALALAQPDPRDQILALLDALQAARTLEEVARTRQALDTALENFHRTYEWSRPSSPDLMRQIASGIDQIHLAHTRREVAAGKAVVDGAIEALRERGGWVRRPEQLPLFDSSTEL